MSLISCQGQNRRYRDHQCGHPPAIFPMEAPGSALRPFFVRKATILPSIAIKALINNLRRCRGT
jgi:hypothetical protein